MAEEPGLGSWPPQVLLQWVLREKQQICRSISKVYPFFPSLSLAFRHQDQAKTKSAWLIYGTLLILLYSARLAYCLTQKVALTTYNCYEALVWGILGFFWALGTSANVWFFFWPDVQNWWKNLGLMGTVCANSILTAPNHQTNSYWLVPHESLQYPFHRDDTTIIDPDFKSPNWHGILMWIYSISLCNILFILIELGRIWSLPVSLVIFDQSNLPLTALWYLKLLAQMGRVTTI